MLIDRLVARTGGRRFVEGRPGMGWLAAEVVPALVWTSLTGAISLEFFYFVAFLTALGASEADLVWLSAAVFAAGTAQVALVLLRRPQDAKRRCVRDTLIGRLFWFGTILWPLLAWWQGWPVPVLVAGAYAFVFLGQLVHLAGIANFITWTQAVVPRDLRGHFYAWRNLASYAVVAVVLGLAGFILPGAEAGPAAQIPALGLLLLVATVIGVVGVWPLARGPDLPPEETPRPPQRLRDWRSHPPFVRFLVWSLGIHVDLALAPALQPRLYLEAGVGPDLMARWQAAAFYPAMILGILAAARLLPRLHGRMTLLIASVLWIAAEAAILGLDRVNAAWMGPLSQTLLGLAKGIWSVAWISRLQEVIPERDPRWSALVLGLGASVSLAACLVMGPLTPTLTEALAGGTTTVAWVLVAVGLGVRILMTPLLLRREAT